ncbi:hypothetical protein TNCV_2685351 [Trichonephila clavipes]|nr:hypothetical protein TNCV_2685351 [Trichonephila clavipes]
MVWGGPLAASDEMNGERLGIGEKDSATIIGSDEDKKPFILTGDFNVNFASEEAIPLIAFLKQTLNLTMNTDAREKNNKRYGTMIDAVFSCFLD